MSVRIINFGNCRVIDRYPQRPCFCSIRQKRNYGRINWSDERRINRVSIALCSYKVARLSSQRIRDTVYQFSSGQRILAARIEIFPWIVESNTNFSLFSNPFTRGSGENFIYNSLTCFRIILEITAKKIIFTTIFQFFSLKIHRHGFQVIEKKNHPNDTTFPNANPRSFDNDSYFLRTFLPRMCPTKVNAIRRNNAVLPTDLVYVPLISIIR